MCHTYTYVYSNRDSNSNSDRATAKSDGDRNSHANYNTTADTFADAVRAIGDTITHAYVGPASYPYAAASPHSSTAPLTSAYEEETHHSMRFPALTHVDYFDPLRCRMWDRHPDSLGTRLLSCRHIGKTSANNTHVFKARSLPASDRGGLLASPHLAKRAG